MILDFDHQVYPSTITSQHPSILLRTILPHSFSKFQLSKLTSINHPYLIKIKKVVKVHQNDQQIYHPQRSYYALYYQAIPSAKPTWKNIPLQLQSIVKYLISHQIYYPIQKKDIIFTIQGQMKVFVPPMAIIYPNNPNNTLIRMQEAYNNIINWCQQQKTQENILRMIRIDKQIQQIKGRMTQKQINDSKQSKEIKKMKNNVDICILNQTQKKLGQCRQRTKTQSYLEELSAAKNLKLSQQQSEDKPNFGVGLIKWPPQQCLRVQGVERIQQNINCINIYHTNQYDLPKSPINNQKQFMNKKIYEAYDSDSLDTYQKQMGEMKEMPKIFVTKLRHTVLPISQQYSRGASTSLRRSKDYDIQESGVRKQFSQIIKGALPTKGEKSQIRKSNIFQEQLESSASSIKIKADTYALNHIFSPVQIVKIPQQLSKTVKTQIEQSNIVTIQQKVTQALNKTKAALETLKKVRNNTPLNRSKNN